MKYYKAPWSTSLLIVSVLATSLCLGITVGMIWLDRGVLPWFGSLSLALVIGAAPFAIRGYTITPQAILVHRLFWATRLPLAGLESAQFEPEAMRHSIRLFGNGGFFSFSGLFRNRTLGSYRAFVTDQHRTVVLHYPKRTVVISPAAPQEFIRELSIPGAGT